MPVASLAALPLAIVDQPILELLEQRWNGYRSPERRVLWTLQRFSNLG